MIKHSVCENPVDIEAREIENTAYYGFDWIGSSNVLIHDSNLTNSKMCGNSPTWSYGISNYGLVILVKIYLNSLEWISFGWFHYRDRNSEKSFYLRQKFVGCKPSKSKCL